MNADFTTGADGLQQKRGRMPEAVKGALVVAGGAAIMIAMAVGGMMALTSPDGWVMKAANQAMTTAQQGALATYDIAFDR